MRFMKLLPLLIPTALFLSQLMTQQISAQFQPDLVVRNANVITIDEEIPRATAFAVHQGKFIMIGSDADLAELADSAVLVIDAEGKTIVPGFNDAHLHPGEIYPEEHILGTVDIGPGAVKTIDELVAKLKNKAAIIPEGNWIVGGRYEDTKLGRHPTRYDLDNVSTTHPVSIRHSSGHVAVYNSYALELAGIDTSTPDPDGGSFDRDADGVPNGVARESASGMVSRAGPKRPEPSLADRISAMDRCLHNYLSRGVTSIGDAGASPNKLKLFRQVQKAGNPIRISLMIRDSYLDELKAAGIQQGFGDEHLRISAIKVFHGNSLSGRTCWLNQPYEIVNPETGEKDYYGIPPKRSQEELNQLIADIHNAGFQAAVHSNGDREIPMVLEAFEQAMQQNPRPDPRHRIEHCSVVNEGILQKLKALGVMVAPHSYIYEHGDKMEEYGFWRWNNMHANRSFLDRGIPVAQTSDSPVSASDPLLRILSMVTRTSAEGKVYGSEQRVTVQEAIRTWTLGGAYATFEEGIKGSITNGKLADFVILSDNPEAVDPLTIKDIAIEAVYIDGKPVYQGS